MSLVESVKTSTKLSDPPTATVPVPNSSKVPTPRIDSSSSQCCQSLSQKEEDSPATMSPSFPPAIPWGEAHSIQFKQVDSLQFHYRMQLRWIEYILSCQGLIFNLEIGQRVPTCLPVTSKMKRSCPKSMQYILPLSAPTNTTPLSKTRQVIVAILSNPVDNLPSYFSPFTCSHKDTFFIKVPSERSNKKRLPLSLATRIWPSVTAIMHFICYPFKHSPNFTSSGLSAGSMLRSRDRMEWELQRKA